MRMAIVGIALSGTLLVAAPAQAAGGVEYKGKTSSGHPVTFKLKGKRIYDMQSGIRVSCVPIQGGGAPLGGSETFTYKGWVSLSRKGIDFTFMKKPAFHFNEVTTKHTLSSRINRRTRRVTGKQRIQYSFMVSKYPIGTFVIYSCLGSGEFKAKPVRSRR